MDGVNNLEAAGLRLVALHINKVQAHLNAVVMNLLERANRHDLSKYSDEEIGLVLGKPTYDQLEYMSEAERAALANVRPAIEHHYEANSHHPEHYPAGIAGMSLPDLLEMICDWKAASEMSVGGSFANSLTKNRERFNLSPELVAIFQNTAREFGWL